jgi:uncharacterized membrane protein
MFICTYIYIHTHTHTHTHTHILLAQGLIFIITRAGGVGALGRAEPVCDTYTQYTHTHTHTAGGVGALGGAETARNRAGARHAHEQQPPHH